MTFVNRILNGLGVDDWILMRGRDRFLDLLRERLPELVRDFYVDMGATPDQRWGDKHPHYADPYHDPEVLGLILELFSDSQFVHIIRDGRAVVASNVAKGWGTLDYACDSWRRHVVHARDFGTSLGPDQYLELRYEALVESPGPTTAAVFDFLGVGTSDEVDRMLAEQDERRTPFSAPTGGRPTGVSGWRDRYDDASLDRVERNLADLLVELAYEPPVWRRELLSRPAASDASPPLMTVAGHARTWRPDVEPPRGTGRVAT